MADGTNFLLEKTNVSLHQSTMLRCCRPIQTGRGRESHSQITDCCKLLIPFDDHDTKSPEEVHLVSSQQSRPNGFLGPVGKMGDRGKAHLGAECREENMPVHKKTVNGKFHILVDLYELRWDLGNALLLTLALPSDGVTLQLDDRSAPDHFCSLDVINGNI